METLYFSIPSLPPDLYTFVLTLVERFGLTQRQVVIAALDALSTLGAEQRERLDKLIVEVKRAHPAKGGRPRRA